MDTFFTVLMPGTDFKQKLALSRNFETRYGSKLPETVVLTVSTTGNKVWNVGLTRTNEDTFFYHGWEQFAVENSLEENDFLIFKFNETDSSFDVLLFDKTACGKKTAVPSVVEDSLDLLQITEEGSDDVLSGGSSGHSSESSENTSDKPWDNSSDRSSSSVKRHKRGKSIEKAAGLAYVHSCKSKEKAAGTSRNLSYHRYFQSSRRPVTIEEKGMALQKAQAFRSTRPHFTKVMVLSHVYRRFFVTIPKWFVQQNFQVPVTAILRVAGNPKPWKVSIVQNGSGSIQHVGISAGWVDFVRDHNLEEGDACVFELDTNTSCKSFVTIEVTIFRVVDDIVPLQTIVAH